jgi:hypothetical protein
MGRVGKILDSERVQSEGAEVTDLKVDMGGGDIVSVQLICPPGVDALPLAGEYVDFERSSGSGVGVANGTYDPKLEPKAEPGEIGFVARDALGSVVTQVYLRKDGTARIVGNVSIEGDLTVTGEVTAKSGPQQVTLGGHLHPTGTGPSGAPTPGT